ncbi:hypothetical protein L1987_63882 [Smallanthus sonchifolius]|uniref:Uncharacterized protein n=1 Tax=Smallanthus sonchifolius TaxID=185202 RepID=A0ACB9CEK5_9ASTR|nr:hypothetical protein L1987_63882 [Smallanthus sonchifolius]
MSYHIPIVNCLHENSCQLVPLIFSYRLHAPPCASKPGPCLHKAKAKLNKEVIAQSLPFNSVSYRDAGDEINMTNLSVFNKSD